MNKRRKIESPARRRLLSGIAWSSWAMLVAAAGLGFGALMRFLGGGGGQGQKPAPVAFAAEALPAPGQVASRSGVALLRDAGGYHALELKCPHLGCAPAWRPELGRFVCPCHGSAFAGDGALLQGPAQRGLQPLAVRRGENGALVVDPTEQARPGQRLEA